MTNGEKNRIRSAIRHLEVIGSDLEALHNEKREEWIKYTVDEDEGAAMDVSREAAVIFAILLEVRGAITKANFVMSPLW